MGWPWRRSLYGGNKEINIKDIIYGIKLNKEE